MVYRLLMCLSSQKKSRIYVAIPVLRLHYHPMSLLLREASSDDNANAKKEVEGLTAIRTRGLSQVYSGYPKRAGMLLETDQG